MSDKPVVPCPFSLATGIHSRLVLLFGKLDQCVAMQLDQLRKRLIQGSPPAQPATPAAPLSPAAPASISDVERAAMSSVKQSLDAQLQELEKLIERLRGLLR